MDFKALIEFNKYTLTLSAASFAYALDKFTPPTTSGGRLLLLLVLATFFLCTVLGVIIFAAATSAQNPNKADMRERLAKVIEPLGMAHAVLLLIGLLLLGWMLCARIMAEPDSAKKVSWSVIAPGRTGATSANIA